MNPCRIVIPERQKVSIESFNLPSLGSNEVLVKTLFSAISPGTEVARIRNITNPHTKYPYFPGYSACCKVIDKGTKVNSFEIGQTVVCQIPHASHWIIEEQNCFLLPKDISNTEGAVIRIGTISLQGVRKAEIQDGMIVAILGLGPIGSFANQIARCFGAAFIAGIDTNKWRCVLAMECGIDKAVTSIEELDLAGEVDVIIEATGNPETIPEVLAIIKKMGRVILLGSHRGVTSQVDFYNSVHKKGLTIIGAHDSSRYGTLREDIETMFKLIIQQRVDLKPLITNVAPYMEAEKVYECLLNKIGNRMITVLDWNE